MKLLRNDLLLRALRCETVTRPPVWMMRQAGRYLPEYRAVREKADFFTMVRSPELATEVTLQPIRRFNLDAAIVFSDILVIPQALGLEVLMNEGEGPSLPAPIRMPDDISRLGSAPVERELSYVFDAIKMICRDLDGDIPLIGFAGAPWTIFAYMTQGGGSKSFNHTKRFLFNHSVAAHELLERITAVTIDYLLGQIEAGASVVQLFDSWAGLLSPEDYFRFALPCIENICAAVGDRAPLIIFAKDAHFALERLAQCRPAALGLDWTIDPRLARARVPGIALQGNLDPGVLYAPPAEIRARTRAMIRSFGPTGHIANLGHGISPDVDPDHAGAFFEAVKEFSWSNEDL